MVIDKILAAVYVCEDSDFFADIFFAACGFGWEGDIQHVGGDYVEVRGVPLCEGIELRCDETEMSEFMDRGGTGLEALDLAFAEFGGFIVKHEFFRHGLYRSWLQGGRRLEPWLVLRFLL